MFESVALPADEKSPDLHDGGLAVPKMADRPRLNKPPLIYWLQVTSAAAFTRGDPQHDALWMYRLPSVLAALGTVLITWRFGSRLFDPSTGLLAGTLIAICPMVVWDAHQARADQVLLVCTTSAMFALWSIHHHDRHAWHRTLWLWISVGLGVLTKGPITPVVLVLTAIGLSWIGREWRWIKRTNPLVGVAIVVLSLTPWVVLVSRHIGFSVFINTIVDETLGRSASAKEGHWGPPGYHTVLLAVLFWPGSMLTLAAFVRTCRLAVQLPPAEQSGLVSRLRTFPRRFRERVLGRRAELFIIAWIVPSWILFELVATKLPHYTLPMYPAIAMVSAKAVLDAARAHIDTQTAERLGAGLGIWLAIGIAICVVAPIGLALLGGGAVAVVVSAILAAACGYLLFKARTEALEGLLLRAQLRACVAAVLFAATTLGFVLPRAQTVWPWTRAVAAMPTDRPIAVAGQYEESVIFLTRARIERISRDEGQRWLRRHPTGVLLLQRSDSTGELAFSRIDTFAGYNYAGGRFVTLDLVERER